MLGKLRGRRPVARTFRLPDANVEMWNTEGDGQIAVENPDVRWRAIGAHFPRRSLDDGTERDLAPMIFEQIAQEGFKAVRVCWKRKDVERRPVGIDGALGQTVFVV